MKLLKTINKLIREAETNLYNASLKNNNEEEVKKLNKDLEDTINLLDIYEDLF